MGRGRGWSGLGAGWGVGGIGWGGAGQDGMEWGVGRERGAMDAVKTCAACHLSPIDCRLRLVRKGAPLLVGRCLCIVTTMTNFFIIPLCPCVCHQLHE